MKIKAKFNLDEPMLREVRIRRMMECGRCGWDSNGDWISCAKHKYKSVPIEIHHNLDGTRTVIVP